MTTASKSPRSFVSPSLQRIPRSGIRDFFDIVSARKDVISLGIGEPDFVTPWHVREQAMFALDRASSTDVSAASNSFSASLTVKLSPRSISNRRRASFARSSASA